MLRRGPPKGLPENARCSLGDAGLLAQPWTRDIEDPRTRAREPITNRGDGLFEGAPFEVDREDGFPELMSDFFGEGRPTRRRTEGEDQCRIRITHVALCTGFVGRGVRLGETFVTLRDQTVLCATAPRNPAANCDAELKGNVPR